MRWHVRAYCEKNQEYRDFVLSRLRGVPDIQYGKTENGIEADNAWNTSVTVIIKPYEGLTQAQKLIIQTDFGMIDGQLEIPSYGALVKYILRRYQIDPKYLDPKPEARSLYNRLERLPGLVQS